MSIGENIKRIRTEKKMTQKELGEKLGGISQQQIGRWENGNAKPKIDTIQKIAQALGVYLGDIYEDDNLPNSKTFESFYQQVKQENIPREVKQQKILDYASNILYQELKFENQNITQLNQNTLFYSELIKRDLALLNETGQKKVADYTKDLSQIPEYQKEAVKRVEGLTEIPRYTKKEE